MLLLAILFVRDFLQPIDGLAAHSFLNRDVRHRRRRRGAMPVLLVWRKPHNVSSLDLLDGPSPALRAAAARRHDERLAQWVRMPRRPGAGIERDTCADGARRIGGLKQRIDSDRAG